MTNSNNMKLIIIVVNDTDSESLLKALLNEGYRVTRIASSGGFMRRGSSTLLMGVEAGSVERAMKMVREHCAPSVDPSIKKVTIFVLKVDKFEQL
ncbi:MAG: cyclic-di-AMP receptor [Chloroflexota bacterium]